MKALVVTTKNKNEYKFLSDLLKKLRISSSNITVEEIEDIGLSRMMKNTDRSKKVSKETIMRKLKA